MDTRCAAHTWLVWVPRSHSNLGSCLDFDIEAVSSRYRTEFAESSVSWLMERFSCKIRIAEYRNLELNVVLARRDILLQEVSDGRSLCMKWR